MVSLRGASEVACALAWRIHQEDVKGILWGAAIEMWFWLAWGVVAMVQLCWVINDELQSHRQMGPGETPPPVSPLCFSLHSCWFWYDTPNYCLIGLLSTSWFLNTIFYTKGINLHLLDNTIKANVSVFLKWLWFSFFNHTPYLNQFLCDC